MKTLQHGEKDFNILFIRRELDDYILLSNEFRVYAHLARRAGARGAWPAVESMAKKCRLHEDTVRRCLRRLRKLNLVKAHPRPGATTLYILTPLSEWRPAHLEEKTSSNSQGPQKPRGNALRSSCRKVQGNGGGTLLHGEMGFNIMFIRAELDDYILSANEFRLYAHLARRAGSDGAWPSVDSMAKTCRLNQKTIRRCLCRLKELNLVKAQERPGSTTLYTLTPFSEWKSPSQDDPSQTEGAPLVWEGGTPKAGEDTPPKVRETKVSQEGNPMKDNTAAGLSALPALPPGGSVTASHHAALNGKDLVSTFKPRVSPGEKSLVQRDSSMVLSGNGKGPPIQTPITKKAYAVAGHLFRFHWDNCKVRFVKETARAYAEDALRGGHDQRAILKAYDKTLHYCHGLATDEILDGKRHQHEKASPALTVWLARQRLSGDPQTLEERWKVVIARLTAEKQMAIEEEERIRQEAAGKASEIKAWFSSRRNHETSKENQRVSLPAEPESIAA